MFGLGLFEIIIILVIALIFIGPKKLPEVAKNLGKGLRDFQNAVKGITDTTPTQNENPPPKTYATHNDDDIDDYSHNDDGHHDDPDDEDVIHTTAIHTDTQKDSTDKKDS